MTAFAAPPIYVLCSSQLQYELWHTRSLIYADLQIKPVYPVGSAIGVVYELVAKASGTYVVVCQDDIWFGLGFGDVLRQVISDLDRRLGCWGVCGNRGVRWDSRVLDFTRDANGLGLQSSVGPQPVLTIGDNLLLLNTTALRALETQQAWPGLAAGLPLSLECLRRGIPVVADPRLFTLRLHNLCSAEQGQLVNDEDFRRYYLNNFVNHFVPTADSVVDFSSRFDYSYLLDVAQTSGRLDIFTQFDMVLAKLRSQRRPSLTLCCRTQFRRPEMLQRTIASFVGAKIETGNLADVHLALITDTPGPAADAVFSELDTQFPHVGLECWVHDVRPERYSRADLLFAAIERAGTDYIWFVDDDDYIIPSGCRAVARDLIPEEPRLLVGNSITVRERWSELGVGVPGRPRRTLDHASREGQFKAQEVFRAFDGENRTPVCSVVIPVDVAKCRLAGKRGLGDYNEDYFVLMLVLTSRRIEVCIVGADIAAISLRGDENTVAQVDKSRWHLSYCTFVEELMNDRETNNPVLWQEGNFKG